MGFRLALLAFLVSLLCPPAGAGDVVGSVVIESKVPPRAKAPRNKVVKKGDSRYPQAELLKAMSQGEGGLPPGATVNELLNVVVHLVEKERKTLACTPPAKSVNMDQANKEFAPHVLPIVNGTRVRFQNSDRIFHHIFSVSNPGGFEIPKHINHTERNFEHAHPFELFCGIHPRMNAYIYVVENDFFTQPDAKGNFRLKGVPAGTYTLRAWHPRLGSEDHTVQVPAQGQAERSFTL